MSVEENVRAVRTLLAVRDMSELDRVLDLLAPDYVHHCEGKPVWLGRSDYRNAAEAWFVGFPDIQAHIDDLIAAEDKVVARVTWTGTHKGVMAGYPPTGKQVTVTCISIYQFAEGRVVADWEEWDKAGWLAQLADDS